MNVKRAVLKNKDDFNPAIGDANICVNTCLDHPPAGKVKNIVGLKKERKSIDRANSDSTNSIQKNLKPKER